MAIKDFASDGAFGAAGSSTGSSGTDEQSAMGYGGAPSGYGDSTPQVSAGSDASAPISGGSDAYHPSVGLSAPMSDANLQAYDTARRTPASATPSASPFGGPAAQHMGGGPMAYNAIGNPMAYNSLAMFADGGSVDDGSSGDVGSLLALALSSVDAGLDYGRKKYGLSQDKGQQQAAMGRTPAIPGNQSDSGIPRPQPMPGPLPPTSNPFGQRKQFGQNDDQEGTQTAQAGAIPDNDEADEGTA